MDELAVMDGSKCILQLRGVRPFLSDKYDLTKHKNYRFLSDSNPKHAFNIGQHVSRKLIIKPDDQFEVAECIESDEEMPEEAFGDFADFHDYPEDLEPI
jgi:type IV secretion system protein VirD4